MNIPADNAVLELAEADLCARLNRQLARMSQDPQADVMQLIEAEKTLDAYLQAAAGGQAALPDRQAIAWSCLMLLLIGDDFNLQDYNTIVRIHMADATLSPHDAVSAIQSIRNRIIGKWERRLTLESGANVSQG